MSIPRPIAQKLPKILVIVGPTASGKTALAIKIALRLGSGRALRLGSSHERGSPRAAGQAKKLYGINGAEIVSADSRQIYRGMDIGTAKHASRVKGQWSGKILHHLIDIKNLDEDYSVADYKKDAIAVIKKVLRRGKLPILVGGTGLYIKAVVENLGIPKVAADAKLRKRLESEIQRKGLAYLFQKLVKLDPEARYTLDQQNPRRVIRALEVTIKTGRPFSAQRKTTTPLFNAFTIGLEIPGAKLKKKISIRVERMIKNGLLEEVRDLAEKYGAEQKAFDAIGYREIIDYINNKTTLEEAIAAIKKNTWAYAKRQLTWFKKDKKILWIKSEKEAMARVRGFL